jgi:hypothetical protein
MVNSDASSMLHEELITEKHTLGWTTEHIHYPYT